MNPTIEASRLTKAYGTNTVLNHVTFTAASGEIVAITGASGSGKTTLLNLLGLLDTPTAGTLHLAGQPVPWDDPKKLRHYRATQLGFVFQDAMMDPRRTSFENVTQALRYAGTPRNQRTPLATASLQHVSIDHRTHALSNSLSGGERQRVAIARAIAHHPKILLCDEPTGALDATNTKNVLDVLRRIATTGVTVLLVTHDLDAAQIADRHLALHQGRIQENTTNQSAPDQSTANSSVCRGRSCSENPSSKGGLNVH